ncbi:MAG: alkaline phosphatase family protein [Phycisphaerae bacterium]
MSKHNANAGRGAIRKVCVVEIAGLSGRLLASGARDWPVSPSSQPTPLRTVFPSVPPVLQASMTTGVIPGVHGIVSGGIFRRQSRRLGLDERSNTLLNKKRFWQSRHLPARPTVAMLFGYHPLAGAADIVVGVSSYGSSCGRAISQPVTVGRELVGELGGADARGFAGPDASWKAGEWTTAAAGKLFGERDIHLMWVYLPGVNFELIRHGPEAFQVSEALDGVCGFAGRIAEDVSAAGGETVLIGNGGYTAVSRVGTPNERLYRAGLLKLVDTPEGPVVDLDRSRAFAMTDHQLAHLYCDDETIAAEAEAVVLEDPAVERVCSRSELFEPGLGHDRAGERVAIAAADAWLAYQWWSVDDTPPLDARRPGFAGKCGYDPCELFAGDEPGDIDPDPSRVRATRGRVDIDPDDSCVVGGTCELPFDIDDPCATDMPAILRRLMFE